jgi:hypothetical protein
VRILPDDPLAVNSPVLTLLTDGRSDPVSAEVAVEKVRVAKLDGITIITIGLGDASPRSGVCWFKPCGWPAWRSWLAQSEEARVARQHKSRHEAARHSTVLEFRHRAVCLPRGMTVKPDKGGQRCI